MAKETIASCLKEVANEWTVHSGNEEFGPEIQKFGVHSWLPVSKLLVRTGDPLCSFPTLPVLWFSDYVV